MTLYQLSKQPSYRNISSINPPTKVIGMPNQLHDYMFVWRDRDGSSKYIPCLVERKSKLDVAPNPLLPKRTLQERSSPPGVMTLLLSIKVPASMQDGRWESQKARMRATATRISGVLRQMGRPHHVPTM